MPYRRSTSFSQILTGDDLTKAMAGIGMAFAEVPAPSPNIENTVLSASVFSDTSSSFSGILIVRRLYARPASFLAAPNLITVTSQTTKLTYKLGMHCFVLLEPPIFYMLQTQSFVHTKICYILIHAKAVLLRSYQELAERMLSSVIGSKQMK